MGNERVCVYIPVDEYRKLIRAERDVEILMRFLREKSKDKYGTTREELTLICKMFEIRVPEDDEEW